MSLVWLLLLFAMWNYLAPIRACEVLSLCASANVVEEAKIMPKKVWS
jgi:hypothetical protein